MPHCHQQKLQRFRTGFCKSCDLLTQVTTSWTCLGASTLGHSARRSLRPSEGSLCCSSSFPWRRETPLQALLSFGSLNRRPYAGRKLGSSSQQVLLSIQSQLRNLAAEVVLTEELILTNLAIRWFSRYQRSFQSPPGRMSVPWKSVEAAAGSCYIHPALCP